MSHESCTAPESSTAKELLKITGREELQKYSTFHMNMMDISFQKDAQMQQSNLIFVCLFERQEKTNE